MPAVIASFFTYLQCFSWPASFYFTYCFPFEDLLHSSLDVSSHYVADIFSYTYNIYYISCSYSCIFKKTFLLQMRLLIAWTNNVCQSVITYLTSSLVHQTLLVAYISVLEAKLIKLVKILFSFVYLQNNNVEKVNSGVYLISLKTEASILCFVVIEYSSLPYQPQEIVNTQG